MATKQQRIFALADVANREFRLFATNDQMLPASLATSRTRARFTISPHSCPIIPAATTLSSSGPVKISGKSWRTHRPTSTLAVPTK